jgi:hypothetical protein
LTDKLYSAAYNAGIKVAQEVDWAKTDWTSSHLAGCEISDAAYAACGDSKIAYMVTVELLESLYQERRLNKEWWNKKRWKNTGKAVWNKRNYAGYNVAYDAGIKIAQKIDWADSDVPNSHLAVCEISSAVYAACKGAGIASTVTLDVLRTLVAERKLDKEKLKDLECIANNQDTRLRLSEISPPVKEWFDRDDVPPEKTGFDGDCVKYLEYSHACYDAMEAARRVDWTEPDAAGREMFRAVCGRGWSLRNTAYVTDVLLKILHQEGMVSKDELNAAMESVAKEVEIIKEWGLGDQWWLFWDIPYEDRKSVV